MAIVQNLGLPAFARLINIISFRVRPQPTGLLSLDSASEYVGVNRYALLLTTELAPAMPMENTQPLKVLVKRAWV